VLVANDGHLKLADYGLSKEIEEGENNYNQLSPVGSHAYLAPEVLEGKPHGKSIDWYLVGTLLYEFTHSMPPFITTDEEMLHENIKKAPLKVHDVSPECKDLLSKLLNKNPYSRLGAYMGFQEIAYHPWFQNVDWDDVYKLRVHPKVYKPKQLKDKRATIDMASLTKIDNTAKYRCPQLKNVLDWSFSE